VGVAGLVWATAAKPHARPGASSSPAALPTTTWHAGSRPALGVLSLGHSPKGQQQGKEQRGVQGGEEHGGRRGEVAQGARCQAPQSKVVYETDVLGLFVKTAFCMFALSISHARLVCKGGKAPFILMADLHVHGRGLCGARWVVAAVAAPRGCVAGTVSPVPTGPPPPPTFGPAVAAYMTMLGDRLAWDHAGSPWGSGACLGEPLDVASSAMARWLPVWAGTACIGRWAPAPGFGRDAVWGSTHCCGGGGYAPFHVGGAAKA
jgi:hypothetical protein